MKLNLDELMDYRATNRCVETSDHVTTDFYHPPFDVLDAMKNRVMNEVRGVASLLNQVACFFSLSLSL